MGFCFREEEEALESLPKTGVLFGDLVRTKEDEIVAPKFRLLTSRRLEEETESLITSIVSSSFFSWGTSPCPGPSSSYVHLLLPTDVTLPPLPPIFYQFASLLWPHHQNRRSFLLSGFIGTTRRIVVLQRIKDQEDKADTQ